MGTSKKVLEWATIERSYWTCAIEKHRHQNESVALACIARHPAATRPQKKWTLQRYRDLLTRIANGEKVVAIAKSEGVTPSHIYNIEKVARRRVKRVDDGPVRRP